MTGIQLQLFLLHKLRISCECLWMEWTTSYVSGLKDLKSATDLSPREHVLCQSIVTLNAVCDAVHLWRTAGLPPLCLLLSQENRRKWPGVVFFLNAYKLSTWLFSVWSSWHIMLHIRVERHMQKTSQWVPFPLLALSSPHLTQVGRKKSNPFWTPLTRKWGKGKASLFFHYFK